HLADLDQHVDLQDRHQQERQHDQQRQHGSIFGFVESLTGYNAAASPIVSPSGRRIRRTGRACGQDTGGGGQRGGRSRATRSAIPHWVMRSAASAMTSRFILLVPWTRSTNVIGTSTTRRPCRRVRSARSIWKQ